MIKSELIQTLSKQLPDVSERDLADSVQILLESLSETLASGRRIEIRGFGSFSLHYRPPRNAHNPITGEKVFTKGKHTPHFKPGKALRENVDASRATTPIIEDSNA